MRLLLPAFCLLLAACSNSIGLGDDHNDTAQEAAPKPMQPGLRPVRIGEGGPSFNACAYTGRVVNLSSKGETYLPVRSAPFVEADEVLQLSNGARVFACTRSIDQRWQGVIVPPADAPDTDCGVGAPVESPRGYEGPCKSGWVASAFIQLSAN